MNLGCGVESSLSCVVQACVAVDQANATKGCSGVRPPLVGLLTGTGELEASSINLFQVPAVVLASSEVGEGRSESTVSSNPLVPELLISGEALCLSSDVSLEDEGQTGARQRCENGYKAVNAACTFPIVSSARASPPNRGCR